MDERSMLLLTQLVNANSYVAMEELMEKLHISRRTLYYDLRKINSQLTDHGLDQIENVRSLGFALSEKTKKNIPVAVKELNTQQYYFSEKERKALLAISLIMSTEAIFLKDLMEKIKVSRGTTINELNKLKEEMASFHLLIQFDRSAQPLMDIIQKYANIIDEENLEEALIQYFSKEKRMLKQGGERKPMLSELITGDMIQLQGQASDWQEAIRTAAEPLVKSGSIQPEYITAMIKSVQELGPYVVLAPKIAVPHARPEQGVNRIGISLLTLTESVSFTEDGKTPVNLIIVLAAADSESHLKALAQLSELLSDEENIEKILQANSKATVLQLISQYSVQQ